MIMSPAAYDTFAVIFGVIALGHAILAYIKLRRNRAERGRQHGRATFNTGLTAYCAALG
jgi:uncharacterized membrane protein